MRGRSTAASKPERRVPRASQLGAIQNPLLEWLLTREEEIAATGTDQEKLVLEARGVPWNVKLFCKACEKACKKDGTPDRSKVSTSLSGLERRGLANRHGVRTSHVKLTDDGRAQALNKRADPRTWQEKETINHARYLAGYISEDLHRHGDQMSGNVLHIEFARLAYHLLILEEYGVLQTWQRRELSHALTLLKNEGFEHLLIIAQEPGLKKSYGAELRGLHARVQNEMFTFT